MAINDEEFSRKSATYRKKHMDAVKGLYGNDKYIPPKTNTKRKVKRRSLYGIEDTIQIKLVSWANERGLTMIQIPNAGRRSYWQGQKQVAMGLTKGVSDLFLTNPRSGYHGFWIELKSPGEKPKLEQLTWMSKMQKQGYKAEWYDNFELARDAILEYLNDNG